MISCYCQGNVVQFEVQFIAVHLEQSSTPFCSRLVENLKNRIQNLNFAPVFAVDQIENVKQPKITKRKKKKLNFSYKKSYYVSDHTCVNEFLKMIKQGPFPFCCLCNMSLQK